MSDQTTEAVGLEDRGVPAELSNKARAEKRRGRSDEAQARNAERKAQRDRDKEQDVPEQEQEQEQPQEQEPRLGTGESSTASAENGSFLNSDRFDNPDAYGLVAYQTAEDGAGIERIIGPATSAWSPAPLEATDEQKAEAEARNKAFADASKQRLGQLKAQIENEDRSLNAQGDGGSQDTPAL